MPATTATATGALDQFVEANRDYESFGLGAVFTEYRGRIVSTVSGNTYWAEMVTSGLRSVTDPRPASMFRTPGFSVREHGAYTSMAFSAIDDPDELDW